MTIYLWHLAGLILAVQTLSLVGLDLPGYSTSGWAVRRFTFWALFALFTIALVALMRPFEHVPLPWWDAEPRHHPFARWPYRLRATVSVVGVVAVAIGILALAVTGLVGFPFGVSAEYAGFRFTPGLAIAVALVGVLLIRWPAGASRPGSSISEVGAEPRAGG